MTESPRHPASEAHTRRTLDAAVRITLVGLLAYWCFAITRPFLIPVLWGGILAIGLAPVFERIRRAVGGRPKLAAGIFIALFLALLFTPVVLLTGTAVGEARALADAVREGTLVVPPPPPRVADWPLIGEPLSRAWTLTSENLGDAIRRAGPELKGFAAKLLSLAAGLGGVVAQFAISIVVAGVFLAKPAGPRRAVERVFARLAGEHGSQLVQLAGATVKSVFQGVLGIALIQSVAAGIGMLAAGVPAAGLWAVGVLILAVVQLPPLLILGPVAVWVFSTATTTVAVLFLVWALVVSASDAFLKPLWLGRGVDVPMLVILTGAIGGMILHGIIGLFVGAVVLALAFELLEAWLDLNEPERADTR